MWPFCGKWTGINKTRWKEMDLLRSYLGDRIDRNWGLLSCGVEGTEGKKLRLKFSFGARQFSKWCSHASKIRNTRGRRFVGVRDSA